jgi:hypothetical protein
MQAFNNIRSAIKNLAIENLILCGTLCEPDVYFQNDILNDTYKKTQVISHWLANNQ